MKKVQNIIRYTQDAAALCYVILFIFDYSCMTYTDFSDSPPNLSDKMWYLGEAVFFFLITALISLLNKVISDYLKWDFKNYEYAWRIIALFLLLRLIWEVIWITFGLPATLKTAAAALFSLTILATGYIIFLPYLNKTSRPKK